MEERVAIPVELPVSQSPTVPFWQAAPSPLARHGSLEPLPESADIVIVGSGISGATLAWELMSREPTASVVMLEARTACSGATGRNGGHTKTASYRSFLRNVETLGKAEAVKIAKFEYHTMKAVHTFAQENRIECERYLGETVDIMLDESQLLAAKNAVAALKEALGEHPAAQYEFWDASETEKRFATPGSYGSVSYEAGSINAYRFVTGILKLAISKGLRLFTEAAATSLTPNGQRWLVETKRGCFHAQRVVLATNGYTAKLYPKLQGIVVPLRGQVSMQRRGSKMPPADPPRTYSFILSDGYEYMIQRPLEASSGGDIVIGGGLTSGKNWGLSEYGTVDDSVVDEQIMDYLEGCTPRYFGRNWGEDHPEGRVKSHWTGIMGYSADGRPLCGKVPGENNLFIAASYQGHGMVLAFCSAIAVSSIILKGDLEPSEDDWFPSSFIITNARLQQKFHGRLDTGTKHES